MSSSSNYYYLQQQLRDLLLARSVRRGDFALASGQRSSFYIDARRTTMSGPGLALIGPLGLDRLAMLLSGAETIRDVLLFPTLRPLPASDDA